MLRKTLLESMILPHAVMLTRGVRSAESFDLPFEKSVIRHDGSDENREHVWFTVAANVFILPRGLEDPPGRRRLRQRFPMVAVSETHGSVSKIVANGIVWRLLRTYIGE